jgi:hypothetical protein
MLINEIYRIMAQVRFQGYPLFSANIRPFSAEELSSQRLQIEEVCLYRIALEQFPGVMQ